jgi:hypothetical protein
MVPMYVLMAAFHLSPWMKLILRRGRFVRRPLFRLNPQDTGESASFTRAKHLRARQCDHRRGVAADRARG